MENGGVFCIYVFFLFYLTFWGATSVVFRFSLFALQVMVELGTGFYAEKNLDDAVAFVDRKITLIETNSGNVLKVIQATQSNVESINISMQGKLLEIRAKQEGLKHQAANA